MRRKHEMKSPQITIIIVISSTNCLPRNLPTSHRNIVQKRGHCHWQADLPFFCHFSSCRHKTDQPAQKQHLIKIRNPKTNKTELTQKMWHVVLFWSQNPITTFGCDICFYHPCIVICVNIILKKNTPNIIEYTSNLFLLYNKTMVLTNVPSYESIWSSRWIYTRSS